MARNGKSRPKTRPARDEEKETMEKEGNTQNIRRRRKSGNDPAWYASDPSILRDAASYPFSYNTGATEVHDPALWGFSELLQAPAEQIAGVCSLKVHPVVGTSHYATDPINVAAQSVYSFVRHANSGHSNYDSADLMIYIMAMANMYSYLVFCQRAYGYALTYDQRNRYLPKDLLAANNIDAVDLINNLANFRFWINTLIAKMVSFAVPATMSVFSRLSFLYSDYYIEGTSIKEQLYQYIPSGFYKFELDSNQLGKLAWVAFDYTTPMTTAALMSYGDTLFDAIWSQEDFGIMSGDILKAYGDRIIKLAPLPEYYNIVPKFDPMVLTQMKNADITHANISDIAQDPSDGTIIQGIIPIAIAATDVWYGTSTAVSTHSTTLTKALMASIKDYRILTVDTDAPNPDVVMESTRLKVVYNTTKSWFVAGTEIIEEVVLTVKPGSIVHVPSLVLCTVNNNAYDATSYSAMINMLECAKNFHYIPRIWIATIFPNVSGKMTVSQQLDIDNFTLLTYEDVRKLHEAATINMFAVPSIGKVM